MPIGGAKQPRVEEEGFECNQKGNLFCELRLAVPKLGWVRQQPPRPLFLVGQKFPVRLQRGDVEIV